MLHEEILDENGAAYSATLARTLNGSKLKMVIFSLGDSKERNHRTQQEFKGSTWQEFKHVQEQEV